MPPAASSRGRVAHGSILNDNFGGCRVNSQWQSTASPSQLRIMHVEGDSMAPTLLSGDAVLVDMTRRAPNPPGIFVLDDGMGLVAKRLEHIPNSDPPAVRVISDNKHYPEYERTADEIHIVGRIRWFAREI
ncbi:S24 family peptidase [Paracoccus marinaquae]|uniref:S24 family peptidase n=1 Tax=Paracoccus marinaquae TaxID=2841926 RepID=UPI00211374FC|nr:S24 family peptidase [Paracoccus marinaquae]